MKNFRNKLMLKTDQHKKFSEKLVLKVLVRKWCFDFVSDLMQT